MKHEMSTQEAELSKERAERFALNVLGDDDLAESIADESLDEWIERKGITITENPKPKLQTVRRKSSMATTIQQLKTRISELEEELSDYQDREEQLLEVLGVTDEEETDEGVEEEE